MTAESSQTPTNPFISRFLAGLPRDVAASFTPDQLQAVQRAFGMRHAAPHAIDLRRRVRLFGRGIYIVLLIGRDRPGEAPPRRLLPYGVAAAGVSLALLLLR